MKVLNTFIGLAMFLFVYSTQAQNQLPNSVFGSGGATVSNSSNIHFGTMGEAIIGSSANSSNQSASGFWNVYKQSVITSLGDEETIPLEYKLDQNFPNPFNPTTVIRFALSEKSSVVLKVYDVLGGEVATLVNTEMEIGRYEAKFNADNYSSGIYIYRLSAGSFVSTKKMILVK